MQFTSSHHEVKLGLSQLKCQEEFQISISLLSSLLHFEKRHAAPDKKLLKDSRL